MTTVLCVPLSQQIQSIYIDIRTIYEVREHPSRIYTWTALVTSQILVEIPWNIFCSSLFFVCWYWAAGYSTDRAGYTYLMYGIVFPLYYTTMAQAIASMAPTAEIASVIFGTLYSFVILVQVQLDFSAGPAANASEAMVFCSLSIHWVGGYGCTECRHSHTLSRVSWVKVGAYSVP